MEARRNAEREKLIREMQDDMDEGGDGDAPIQRTAKKPTAAKTASSATGAARQQQQSRYSPVSENGGDSDSDSGAAPAKDAPVVIRTPMTAAELEAKENDVFLVFR